MTQERNCLTAHSTRAPDAVRARPTKRLRRGRRPWIAGVIASLLVASAGAAAPGDLDPSFGTQGVLTRDVLPGTITRGLEPSASVTTADGGMVVAGSTVQNDLFVTRLLVDGAIDPAFGIREFDVLPGSTDEVRGLAVDPSGRIVLGGRAESSGYVIRLTGSGALDTSFDGDGKLILTDPSFISVGDISVDATGAIFAVNTGQYPSKVFRYLPSGALDPAFGIGGISTAADNMNDAKLVRDSAGRILVAGSITGTGYRVYRLQGMADPLPGFYDLGFDGDGVADVTGAPSVGSFLDLEVDAFDRPVMLGNNVGGDGFELVRLTGAGALDGAFDTDGVQVYAAGAGASDAPFDLEISGTTMYVGGRSSAANNGFITAVASDGGLSAGFGGGSGLVTVPCDPSGVACTLTDLAIDSGLGHVMELSPPGGGTVAQAGRHTGSGAPLNTFGGDGVVAFAPQRPWGSQVIDSVKTSDGSIYTLGASGPNDNTSTYIIKQLANGSLDPAFGSGGRIVVDLLPGNEEPASALAVAPSGAVYVVGSDFTVPTPTPVVIWKFTAAGLDTLGGFGVAGRAILTVSSRNAFGQAIAVDAAGRLVIGGGDSDPNPPNVRRVWLHRVNATSGALDATFNGGAARFFDLPDDSNEGLSDIAILADGSIVGAGSANSVAATVKVDANGQPDASFGVAGVRTYPALGNLFDPGLHSTLAGGAVHVAATVNDGPASRKIVVARLAANGEIDATFGGAAGVSVGAGNNLEDAVEDVSADAAGRILVVGWRGSPFALQDALVARITPGGQLDGAFAGAGVVVRDLSGGTKADRLSSVFEHAGAIVAIGEVIDPATGEDRHLTARLLGDPAPPVVAPSGSSRLTAPRHATRVNVRTFRFFRGTATATGSPIRRVQIAVRKIEVGRCRWLASPRVTFVNRRPVARRCTTPVWITVSGTTSWRLRLTKALPAGRYEVRSRVVLRSGFTESRFVLRRNLATVSVR